MKEKELIELIKIRIENISDLIGNQIRKYFELLIFFTSHILHKIFSLIKEDYFLNRKIFNLFRNIKILHLFKNMKGASIGIIPDGNRRFYRKYLKNFKKSKYLKIGYENSLKIIEKIIKFCEKLELKSLTIFCLSKKNLQRENDETAILFDLFEKFLNTFRNDSIKENIQIRIYGNINLLPKRLQKLIKKINADNSYLCKENILKVNLLMAYSGKDDLSEINKNNILNKEILCTENLDLIIRSGMTYRLSDFMLFSFKKGCKIVFIDRMFPDLNPLYFLYILVKNLS